MEGKVKADRVSSGKSEKERRDDRGRCCHARTPRAGRERAEELADELDGGGRHGRSARGGRRWESICLSVFL